MKTAVIYARYSSDSQTEQSIDGQLRVCQQYAKNNDILVVDTYIDRAMTGTNDNRLAFQKMLKDSNKKQWSVVLVYKLDRFSRNKYESVIHKKTLKDNGVKLVSAMENIPDTPEGTLMEALLEGFNQYYSEELTQKVNRGLKESWIKGNATGGRHIFGYDIIGKKYVINEHEAEIVREIYSKYSLGFKANGIAESLNEQNLVRHDGKKFTEKFMFYILHNEKYSGKVTHKSEVYDNIFPQIVDDITWRKVEAINNDNKIAPSRKKEIFDYILSGKLVCGYCKRKMMGESGTSHTKQIHYYYTCTTRRKRQGNCQMKAIQKQFLEDIVVKETSKVLASEHNLELIANAIIEQNKNAVNDNTNLKMFEKQKAQAEKFTKNIVKAIEQGIITEATKTRLQELEIEIVELDFAINKEKQKTQAFLTKEQVLTYLKSQVIENCNNIKIRKSLINTLVREIILYNDKIYINFNFTDPIEPNKITKETIEEKEKQIKSALKNAQGSCILPLSAPNETLVEHPLISCLIKVFLCRFMP